MARPLRVFITGAGGIGSATALILREMAGRPIDIDLGDVRAEAAAAAVDWLPANPATGAARAVTMTAEPPADLGDCDLLLDCLPGSEAPRMAGWARAHGLHYANLTEHVEETREVLAIAAGADTGFLLQTGLAPGFVDVLANGLVQRFREVHEVDRLERVAMRVGALPAHARPPSYYGFTWSPIGVATEYVKPSVVLRDYQVKELPALSDRARVIIGEKALEEALTSGGAADLPQAFAGVVRTLDYKTLRHIGHYDWVKGLVAGLPDAADRPEKLLAAMKRVTPFVDVDDEVVIYVAVDGFVAGDLHRMEKSYSIRSAPIGGKRLKAIQATTAASLAQSALLLADGKHRGPVLQSQLEPWSFLEGAIVRQVYGTGR